MLFFALRQVRPRPRPRLGALLLCLVFAATLLATPRAEAAVPADFFGMETPDAAFPGGYGGAQYRASALDRQRAAGVGLIRQPFYWTHIEPQQGVYSFSTYDSFVGEAAKRGIRVMPVLFGEHSAYSSRPAGNTQPVHYPPRASSYGALGDYGAALARRYGPNGSYWTKNPQLPKLPVRSYQVWNEPHIPFYWGGAPSPAQYSQLLLAASPKIKAVDSGAEIVSAGISDVVGLPGAMSLPDYIQGMYKAGAKAGFDTLGLHPYAKEPSRVMALIDQARGLMVSNGDSASSLRVTEFSWGSGRSANDIDTDEAGQAAKTRSLLTSLVTRRSQLNLRGAIWWIWRDSGNPPGVWTSYTGLVRQDGSEKPVLTAYRSVADGLDPVASFQHAPGQPLTDETVRFDASASSDPDGELVRYEWDLDGNGSYETNTTQPRVEHSYPTSGTRTIGLRVRDDSGATHEQRRSLVVRQSPSAPPPAASVGDTTLTEGNSGQVQAGFTVSLSAPSTRTVTLSYATADDTAKAPGDYSARNASLSFAPGQRTKTVSVPVTGDTIDEPNERFKLTLTNPQNATLGDAQAIATIRDDDAPPSLPDEPSPPSSGQPLRPVVPPLGGGLTVVRDLLPPDVRLSARSRERLGRLRSRGIALRVGCSEPCTFSVRLLLARPTARRLDLVPRKGSAVVGRLSRRLGAAPSARFRMKLTQRARWRLRRARRLRLSLQVVATDRQGNRRTVSRAIVVRR